MEGDITVVRNDLELVNKRGYHLVCSHYIPKDREAHEYPCVIYLHGHSSNRMEAHKLVKYFIPKGITVFCFDFSGSGSSEGEYISLGYYEK